MIDWDRYIDGGRTAKMANEIASHGRFGDTEILHVSKDELRGLESVMPLTTNPVTGKKEAFGFGAFLPFLQSLFTGAGHAAMSGLTSLGGLFAPEAAGAAGAAGATGAAGAAAAPAAAGAAETVGATGATGLTAPANAIPMAQMASEAAPIIGSPNALSLPASSVELSEAAASAQAPVQSGGIMNALGHGIHNAGKWAADNPAKAFGGLYLGGTALDYLTRDSQHQDQEESGPYDNTGDPYSYYSPGPSKGIGRERKWFQYGIR